MRAASGRLELDEREPPAPPSATTQARAQQVRADPRREILGVPSDPQHDQAGRCIIAMTLDCEHAGPDALAQRVAEHRHEATRLVRAAPGMDPKCARVVHRFTVTSGTIEATRVAMPARSSAATTGSMGL